MIKVGESQPNLHGLVHAWGLSEVQVLMLRKMVMSPQLYSYQSFKQLYFELKLRENLVSSGAGLSYSGATFAVFESSRCNEHYWTRTDNGGFLLKPNVTTAEGIRDIFVNGRLYAFECTTAIMIVCYKAILDTIPEATFNRLFPNLFLWNGYYDEDLALTQQPVSDGLPGDIRYFKNPDHSSPEWQGENAVYLGNGNYFGHGVGIASGEMIIMFLNRLRIPGSMQSAFLMKEAFFPNFKYLAQYDRDVVPSPEMRSPLSSLPLIITNVGSTTYLSI
ncbi:protein-glutamine gamma-glutamyltransferase [Ammoniphilus sp. CFH 90114]|uniref:protein-glutamine gamma-glutamyltransferase n=1 Tax=Ammoniphilus sp. CFH 90114 TaxID=2493665 RepID=UPI00100FCD8C|nr:protein-glutamine gamma-glutamyltransferase [Ammoniphilus sp. CFH 90114]RXT02309.1 protein-glutamine gamma-glutamyltransferase [Ammoniphilus sp. CFH 90114]